MSGNAQKTPFAATINRFAEKKVADAIALLGKALPASVVSVAGSIVTVKFEMNAAPFTLPQVTVPIAGPEWIRFPTQAGDKGVVFPASVEIGNISGLAEVTPDWTAPASLSALTFFPIGNKTWSVTDDSNAVVVYGPNGVVLRTRDGAAKITISSTSIIANFNGKKFTLNSSGLTLDCDLIVNGKFTSTGEVSLAGGSQAVKLADNSAATKVKAT
jgi:hypothetical protein